MFRPSEIIISAFINSLIEDFEAQFGEHHPIKVQLKDCAKMILSHYTLSDALYHNLDHTLVVTGVGKDLINGKRVAEGHVSASQWFNFIIACLVTNIGFVRGIFPQDKGLQVLADAEHNIELPKGSTSGALWPLANARSQHFVRTRLNDIPELDVEAVASWVAMGNFPSPNKLTQGDQSWGATLQAAKLIGVVADPNFTVKTRRLILELKEAKIEHFIAHNNVRQFRAAYPSYFWQNIYPLIAGACRYLNYTSNGLEWLAIMHGHLLTDEHNL